MRAAIGVLAVGALAAAFVVGGEFESGPSRAVAQDSKGRVAALETRVAGLESGLATLTARVSVFWGSAKDRLLRHKRPPNATTLPLSSWCRGTG